MQRFKNILVVVDHSSESGVVVERAVDLALRNGACITLASTLDRLPENGQQQFAVEMPAEPLRPDYDIIEEWPPGIDMPYAPHQTEIREEPASKHPAGASRLTGSRSVLIREHVTGQEGQRLEQWADYAQRRGVQVNTKILYGTPFLEIIRLVLRRDHDLVMTTAQGRSNLRDRVFGSTTMHLMRKCPCPVWVVKTSQPDWHKRILASVDPRPEDKERHALNVKIMDLATSLARIEQRELVVLHAWTFPMEHSLKRGRVGPSDQVDRWISGARHQHRQWLVELLKPYDLEMPKHEVYLLKGEPGRLVPEVAAAREVELIVMGTVSRSGVSGLLIGNTAEKILGQVDCGVLAVKPDGFVTPVGLGE
jgi:nucleotide-binding universal stress UspA family protein